MKIFNHAMKRRLAGHAARSEGTFKGRRWHAANMRHMATYSDSNCGDVEILDGGTLKSGPRFANFRYFPIGE
jgi:hypothetical protein